MDSRLAVSCILAITHDLPGVVVFFDSGKGGYTLYVTGLIFDSEKSIVRGIVEKNCLLMREEGEQLVIYSSKSNR